MTRNIALFAVAILLLVAGLATGASNEPPKPDDYSTGSSCEAHAVKHLLNAVDPTHADWQEWDMRAAEAYLKLDAIGFREC